MTNEEMDPLSEHMISKYLAARDKIDYTVEMYKLVNGLFEMDLKKYGITFRLRNFQKGPQVELFKGPIPDEGIDGRFLSAICHDGSYGDDEGLIEIMGLITDDEKECDSVAGWLTAEDVLKRVNEYIVDLKIADYKEE